MVLGVSLSLGMRLSWRCERLGYCVLPGVICLHIVSVYFLLGSTGRRSGGKGRMGEGWGLERDNYSAFNTLRNN